jgi:hypothetical protein
MYVNEMYRYFNIAISKIADVLAVLAALVGLRRSGRVKRRRSHGELIEVSSSYKVR